MFELQRLASSGGRSLALQTRAGQNIRNCVGGSVAAKELRQFETLVKRFGSMWTVRRPPAGEYNCAGHVWASRRTIVNEEEDWQTILRDDGYRLTGHPVPDDIVIYADKQQGILHIARVVELRSGIVEGSRPVPFVVSKWGVEGGETIHSVYDVPFSAHGFEVIIQFWTDRPL